LFVDPESERRESMRVQEYQLCVTCIKRMVFLFSMVFIMVDVAQSDNNQQTYKYIHYVESHLQKILSHGLDRYGSKHTPMWVSTLDTRTFQPRRDHTSARVYRKIGAPNGSTLYWDQPLIAAAIELSRITNNPQYSKAGIAYIKSFLRCCVDKEGLFEWGNHKYYDVYTDSVVGFSGSYHELRPITPLWDIFWEIDPKQCERYIRCMTDKHVYDWQTGGFNRHDNKKREHAFIEAGGVLVESLAWLYSKTNDTDLLHRAITIARYSFQHRNPETGLVKNNPDTTRWDSKVSTTEIGAWAQSVLRAASYASNSELFQMARDAVAAYLKYGFDDKTKQFFGQLDIITGQSVIPKETGYWPQQYSNIYNTDQWPTHDYPMALAEAALTLYHKTGDSVFLEGIERWADIVQHRSPSEASQKVYAGNYGVCIHFLSRAGRVLNQPKLIESAHSLAQESIEQLYENGIFQGLTGNHLYESVDGVGYLCLALLSLDSGQEIDSLSFRF
jgi:hypothetical protein